jgi:hypothetical protein
MSNEPAHVIAEAVAEVQATLFDHYQRGKGTSAQVLAKINVIMSERTLIRAMYDAGYIPPHDPTGSAFTLPAGLE